MSIFDPVFENQEASYRWLRMTEGKPYFKTLRQWRELKMRDLRGSRDPVDVHRAQGALEIIEKLINLPDELIKIVTQPEVPK
jgi:hypothetical protein